MIRTGRLLLLRQQCKSSTNNGDAAAWSVAPAWQSPDAAHTLVCKAAFFYMLPVHVLYWAGKKFCIMTAAAAAAVHDQMQLPASSGLLTHLVHVVYVLLCYVLLRQRVIQVCEHSCR
jgi:hypothetical protein